MQKLPLYGVRTFAVVARLLSISRAAEEINVTPSAVSHQIKLLENYLGVSLFHRERNKITLTYAGREYMAEISEGLVLLERATRTIKAAKGQEIIRVGAPISLIILWLMDRVERFMKANPDVSLTLTAVPLASPLVADAFDITFWYGHGPLPGLSVDSLGENRVFPICRPSLTRGDHALRTPADLARCVLLDSSDDTFYQQMERREPGWFGWLQAAGIPGVSGTKYLNFTPRVLMHRAVLSGSGVGLSRTLLAADALSTKEVTVPFGPALLHATTYNLVCPPQLAKRKDVAAFRDCMLAEAEKSTRTVQVRLKRLSETRERAKQRIRDRSTQSR